MASADYFKLKAQLCTLKELAVDYPGKTIENIICQLEARAKEITK